MFFYIMLEIRISPHVNFISLNNVIYIKNILMIALYLRQLWHDVISEFICCLNSLHALNIEDGP